LATPSVVGHARCRPCLNIKEVVKGREAPDAEVAATATVMVTSKTCIGRASLVLEQSSVGAKGHRRSRPGRPPERPRVP
jgi:hypothetical protein